jgi:hypothetical protein
MTCKQQRAYDSCTQLFYRVMRAINGRIYTRAGNHLCLAKLFANSARGRSLQNGKGYSLGTSSPLS